MVVNSPKLEVETQRHLNLPRAADRVRNQTKSRRTAIERIAGRRRTAIARQYRLTGRRISVVSGILRYFIAGYIEAGGVGQVIDIERVLKVVPLLHVDNLDERSICPLLEGLAEDIALSIRKSGFVWV